MESLGRDRQSDRQCQSGAQNCQQHRHPLCRPSNVLAGRLVPASRNATAKWQSGKDIGVQLQRRHGGRYFIRNAAGEIVWV